MADKKDKKKKQAENAAPLTEPRYKQLYRDKIVGEMMQEFKYSSVMQVPRLEKIVVNIGVGNVKDEPKSMENAISDLTTITGQKPIITRAKKAISNFKIREGWQVGTKVTLRGWKMYDFLDRFINSATPRVRDFRGYSARKMDGRGNYSLGIREQLIFPEIEYDKIDKIRGMDITIVTTAETDQEGIALLRKFGMPFAS